MRIWLKHGEAEKIMTLDGKNRSQARVFLGLGAIIMTCGLTACGGGTGFGPGAIQKREDKLRDELALDWSLYNAADFQGAIDLFTKTLQEADALEGIEIGVRNQVKAEAQDGIGWTFIQLQDLSAAAQAFGIATQLDRTNADAWVGGAGVALALGQYADVLSYTNIALETDAYYNSATRIDAAGRILGHDSVDERHVRLMLAEAYFHLGRYSAVDRPDPNNAVAQVQLVYRDYRFQDPGQLLERISELSLELQDTVSAG